MSSVPTARDRSAMRVRSTVRGRPATHGRPGAGSEPAFRRLPRAVREQQVLDAAVAAFSRHGYHAASVDDIAGAAGVSKPMVYTYLGTKEELFSAVLQREGVRLMEAIVAAAAAGREPDEQLWLGLRAFFGFVATHRDGWAVLYHQARGQRPFAGLLGQMRARLAEVVAGTLVRAAGAASRDLAWADALTSGQVLVGAAEALADRMLERHDEAPDATATRLMNVFWVGAAALLRGDTWRELPIRR